MANQPDSWNTLSTVAFVGSYLPRRCGIATFTADLADGITSVTPKVQTRSVALNDRPEGYRYPSRVWFEINRNRLGEYRLAADFLNMSNVDVCCLQHEFGLFGGFAGLHIVELVRRLRMPVVATLHTVLQEPDDYQLEAMRQLALSCDRLVVLAERAYEFLSSVYGIANEKIALIPHGIPDVPFVDPSYHKDQFGVEGKKVILTFGLLGPSKGIENMIDAMPKILMRHNDIIYLVLGATHPHVMAEQGEDYRLSLRRRAKELGVQDHIEFINKFVELDELTEYLGAADAYVTPYDNEAQIVSGTLAYALGAGKATVSTPYWYAEEMLADGRGKVVPFKDSDALAEAVIDLFDHETQRHAMRKRAYQFTRRMRWPEVAAQYLDLFAAVRQDRNRNPKPVVPTHRRSGATGGELTEIKLDHLCLMTDDVGVFQFAKATIPDRAHGYSVDDNARALIAVLMAQDHLDRARMDLDTLVSRYLSFLDHGFDDEVGRFRNFLGFDRRWSEQIGSQDTHGHALWGLGEAVARCQLRGHMALATNLFQRALPGSEKLESPHAQAFAVIGIHAYLRRFSGDSHARRIREQLANQLFECFRAHMRDDWPWISDKLSYASARLPHALLLSGRWLFNDRMIHMALHVLEWLSQVQRGPDGRFAPVGTDGWYLRGSEKARFNQRPMEAAATIDACLEAFRVTEDRKWLERAERSMNWFLGDNDLRVPLYDYVTGGCADELTPQGINQNQGAEATIAWLLSLLSFYDQTQGGETAEASARWVEEKTSFDGSRPVRKGPRKLSSTSTKPDNNTETPSGSEVGTR